MPPYNLLPPRKRTTLQETALQEILYSTPLPTGWKNSVIF
jgi:hypothetical protein